MRGRFLDRKSRKQFRHPLPPTNLTARPVIPRHQVARITPPPAELLRGHIHRGPVRGLGKTARPVIPGSRRIHQPAPSPQLYAGGTRHGWIDHQTQPRPVARRGRLNRAHGISSTRGDVLEAISHPGKKNGNAGGGGKPPKPPKPPGTARPLIPGTRLVRSPAPVRFLHGHARRGRVPAEVLPFLWLGSRRVQNPRARPEPARGRVFRRHPQVLPTGLRASPVMLGFRRARSPQPWGALRPAVWRGRVPGPTAPFLLREGRRCQGTRPLPHMGSWRRGRVPWMVLAAKAIIRRHRFCRIFLPPAGLLDGKNRHGPLYHTGLSAQTVLFACDVPPLRPERAEDCALRPETSSDPGQRVQEAETCPARPPRCPEET